jgi:hypothetical protein
VTKENVYLENMTDVELDGIMFNFDEEFEE